MQKNKKVLIENTIALGVTQIVSYLLPLISLPYLSRVLGVEKFGLVFWAQALMQYFIIFTDFGFNMSAVREIALVSEDKNKISTIFNSVICVKFILLLISFLILFLLIISVPKFHHEQKLFYLTFCLVIGNVLYPIWYFQGIEHMKYVTFMNILTKTIFLILIFIVIKSSSDYLYVAMLNSLGFLIAGLISIFIAIKRFDLKIFIPDKKDVIEQFKKSYDFFIARAAETLYTNTNSFCLGLITNPTTVGYYVAAEKIFNAINSIQVPFTNALYPYMTKTKNITLYKKILSIVIIFFIFLCISIYFLAPNIITIFYGKDMLQAYPILRIFTITLFFAIICGFIGYPFLAALGYPKYVNSSAIFAAILHVFSLIALYKFAKLNLYTLAFLTAIPEIIMITIRVFYIKKFKLFPEKLRKDFVDDKCSQN